MAYVPLDGCFAKAQVNIEALNVLQSIWVLHQTDQLAEEFKALVAYVKGNGGSELLSKCRDFFDRDGTGNPGRELYLCRVGRDEQELEKLNG
ncbi:hypothetical protein P22_3074 [Propionispora sp. 2/2-37]|uniref:hypothetical protein n=1 Tax=Propionispora sp. 2/2-37 TaxID=1677858 RepID=UPI0006BB7B45|nr:hypothetical protein [Propionispora sp. 2/2-37]CUH96960.1 hypothetical protein P22_3074 [Propionispora sp. 2/2-37]